MIVKGTRTFIVSLVVAVACSAATTPANQTSAVTSSLVDKVWIHVNGPWESPPPEIEMRTRTTPATLFRVSKDGEFSLMHCLVIEQPDQKLAIGASGVVIYLGTWEETASLITTTYQLMYETVQPVGGRKYPGPEQKRTVVPAGKSVQFDGKLFEHAKHIDTAEYEEFLGAARKRLRQDTLPVNDFNREEPMKFTGHEHVQAGGWQRLLQAIAPQRYNEVGPGLCSFRCMQLIEG
jgi:hypothetical protein